MTSEEIVRKTHVELADLTPLGQLVRVVEQHSIIELLGKYVVQAGRGEINSVAILVEHPGGSMSAEVLILPGYGQPRELIDEGLSYLECQIRAELDQLGIEHDLSHIYDGESLDESHNV